MTTRNDVTKDRLVSKKNTNSYRDGWDRIFNKEEDEEDVATAEDSSSEEEHPSN